MEEDPKQHDFDQRHDGPLQEDSAGMSRRHGTDPRSQDNAMSPSAMSPTEETAHFDGTQSPVGRGRPSVDFKRDPKKKRNSEKPTWTEQDESTTPITSPPPRKSTQMSRGGGPRPSEDFDRRYDGPFGRPSITMSRRRSSNMETFSPTGARPSEAEMATHAELSARPSHANDEGEQPPPPSIETMQTDPAFEPEPPSLNYTLRTRKFAIFFFWTVVVFDSAIMPLALYYGLWYGLEVKGKMSPNTVFSIVTAAIGGISIFEYFIRFWRLFKKNSTCRVIGARRMYLDWFHWNYTLGWVIIMLELIIGTVKENPPIRLVAMPVPSMLYTFGTELLIMDALRYFEVPAPVRMSSIPKGAQVRPGIYNIIEDIVAVDGSGGTEFRENFNKRYEASHVFRAMLRRLGLFWSIGAQTAAVVCTILIFTIPKDAAYAVGWAGPFAWAGVWTLCTFWYVNRKLKEEKTAWAEEVAEKSNA